MTRHYYVTIINVIITRPPTPLLCPVQLKFTDIESVRPCVSVTFHECRGDVSLPAERVVESALATLKARQTELFYYRTAWDVIRCYLVATMSVDDDKKTLTCLFTHSRCVRACVWVAATDKCLLG